MIFNAKTTRCGWSAVAFLCLGFGFSVTGWSNTLPPNDLDAIRRRYCPPPLESRVHEITWHHQNYYIVCAVTADVFQDRRTQQRLTLLSKSALLRYLSKPSSGTNSANLRHYYTGLLWREGDHAYGLFYIQKENVTPVTQKPSPSPAVKTSPPPIAEPSAELPPANTVPTPPLSETESLDPDTLRTKLSAEITQLEQHLKEKPKDKAAWYALKDLYQQTGDIENVNRVLEEIIKLEGTIDDTQKP